MDNNTLELLEMLYNMVSEAWSVPIASEKCIIERDKALNLLEEIKNQLPVELAEAKRLVTARDEFISSAKRDAASIRKDAEERARMLVEDQEIVRISKLRSNEVLGNAEARSKELCRATNDYVDDALRRTEEAVGLALEELRTKRKQFKTASAAVAAAPDSTISKVSEKDY